MLLVPDGVRTFRRGVRTHGLRWWLPATVCRCGTTRTETANMDCRKCVGEHPKTGVGI